MKNNAQNTTKLHYLDIMGIFGDDYANYHQPDGLHLNTAAYEIIKNLIKSTVPLKVL
jgi:lysophospholipase L1-like esterase